MSRMQCGFATLVAAVCLLSVGAFFGAPDIFAHPLAGKTRLADSIGRGDISIRLETVATGLTAPNWGTAVPGHPGHLFVTDQVGILWAIDLTNGEKTVFLDVSGEIVPLGFAGEGTFDERGLLGVAFHPDYATNGLVYTFTSEPATGGVADFPVPEGAPANNHGVVAEWMVSDPSRTPDSTDPESLVDPSSKRELLRVGEPQFNHAGGGLNFGPTDGMLYISFGDGGAANDQAPGHTTGLGNGQDTTNVLGTILRIDPGGNNSSNGRYGIPDGNPFVGLPGVDEIYAYGFRNPFRFSIDANGDLYVGDVGQNDIEEVDLVTAAGTNYGWNIKEGSFCFEIDADGGFAFEPDEVTGLCPNAADDGSLIDPIAEYDNHLEGHSVIGGFLYRGSRIPGLSGHYVFGDFSKVFVFTFNDPEQSAFNQTVIHLTAAPGRLFYLSDTDDILEFRGNSPTGTVLGLGRDASGELYVLGNATGLPSGTSGTVHKIVAGGGRGRGRTR